MLEIQRKHGRTFGAGLSVLLMGALLTTLPQSGSAQPCLHGALVHEHTFSTNCLGQPVFGKTHVGSTIGVLIRADMLDDCPGDQTLITNVIDRLDLAPGVFFVTSNLVSHPILLPSLGSTSNIINVTTGPFAGSAYTYTVPPNALLVLTNKVRMIARDTNSATQPNGLMVSITTAQIQVLRPSLSLTSYCTGIGANGLLGFSGSVSNSGDAVLTNVFVLNETMTNSIVVGPIALSVGQSVSFNGSYTPANTWGPNVLTAFGTDELLCTVSATVTQTCLATLNIYTAVEIEFLTKTGLFYQLQASPDLANWTNLGPSFPGDGNVRNQLFSTRSQARLFYRLQQTQ